MDLPLLMKTMTNIGIQAPVNMMIGFPDETENEINMSIDFAKILMDHGAPYVTFFIPIICFSQTEIDTSLMLSELEEIIISATMSERALDKLPIPTTVISKKEIMLSSSSKLYDVINIQTGIISVPTKTGTEGLQMQGLDASYITILLDGFPIIGRSFGALDLNRISVTDIERIEIIKGASSSLYGSNALGGVVNLISKKQINAGNKINLSLKYASHNTISPSLIYQHKNG